MARFNQTRFHPAALFLFVTLCLVPGARDFGSAAAQLAAPAGVSASDGTYADRIRVSWAPVAGATSYLVYRATAEDDVRTMVYTTTASPFYDHVVSAGVTYYYWVRAADEFGFSGYSDFDTGYRTAAPLPGCVSDDTTLCLNDGRFKVKVSWRNQFGQTGVGRVVPYGSDDSGVMWFFDESNWEVLVKILNGCGINNRFWVLFAAPTDQQFTMTVTDTTTGLIHRYVNPLKHPANAVIDTGSFDTCGEADLLAAEFGDESLPPDLMAGEEPPWPEEGSQGAIEPLLQAGEDADLYPGGCVATETRMCLNQGRFEVSVDWRDQGGQSGEGRRVPYGSDDSGMFWFFSDSNWEMLVKVLDGCGLNGHFWVFFAATTDQQFTLTVRDTSTGSVVRYLNPLKHPADAVTDTRAFGTCP